MPTERLYYLNSYIKDFTARVLTATPLANGQYAIVLDRTAFYPESGGQPADHGLLDDIPVLDVREQGGNIVHITAGCPKAQTVSGQIDWPRRFDHMQQHSGEHVLTGAFSQVMNAHNIGFHLGEASSQIDLDVEALTAEQIAAVEEVANTKVFANLAIHIHIVDAAGLSRFPLRKQPVKQYDSLRLIEVPAFDCCPCGGTHVGTTGEIGLIKIRTWERKKSGVRIDFVCGLRALTDYQSKNETVKNLAAALSVPPSELKAAYDRQVLRLDTLTKDLAAAQQELCSRLARDLYARAAGAGDLKIIMHTLTNALPSAVAELARECAGYAQTVALIAGISPDNSKVHLVFAASPALTPAVPMNALLKTALPFIDGKGGGNPQLAQGGGSKPAAVPAALAAAKNLLI